MIRRARPPRRWPRSSRSSRCGPSRDRGARATPRRATDDAGRGGARAGARRARWRGRPVRLARRPAARGPLAPGRAPPTEDGEWRPGPARGDPPAPRLVRARSRPISSSTGRSCAGRPACSAWTSAGTAGRTRRPTTFGLREVEDVAGALAWLGERGIDRVALVGSSMGGITALASVAVLGDGSLPSADADPDAPARVRPPRRPRIVAVVADSVAAGARRLRSRSRLRRSGAPVRRRAAARRGRAQLGGDPRDTEPIRVVGLLEGMPLMLISGEADTTVPIADARRLAARRAPGHGPPGHPGCRTRRGARRRIRHDTRPP